MISVFMCGVCFSIPFNLDVRDVDAPARVKQAEGHTGIFHLPSAAVFAIMCVAKRIQPPLSLVDREVEFCVPTN